MAQDQASPKVLVVDDNAENRALAQATLEDEGYEVLLAGSGEEALALFEAHGPDCVLLDVRMPGMDGFEVCSRIRACGGGVDARSRSDVLKLAIEAHGGSIWVEEANPGTVF